MAVMFDTFVMVDWSGGNRKPAKPSADAIWVSVVRQGAKLPPLYFRSRQAVEPWLCALIDAELTAARRIMIGFDFAFGYPAGFAETITGSPAPVALWDWYEARVEDTETANNRFDLAGQINAMFRGTGPFWGNGLKRDIPHLPRKGRDRTQMPFNEKRAVEKQAKGAFSVWQLSGAGAVGSQVIMGLPVLARLRRHFAGRVAVWPFEPLDAPVAFVEIWPSLFNDAIAPRLAEHPIKDAVQVRVVSEQIAAMSPAALARKLDVPATSEGWIFGVSP